jgi:hypothetical protein
MWSDESRRRGPAVSIARYRHGGVEIALSALYAPYDEIFERGRSFGAPTSDAFLALLDQLELFERSSW